MNSAQSLPDNDNHQADKSSIVDENDVTFSELVRFAKFLAWEHGTPHHPLMNKDEIFSELMLELVKVLPHYSNLSDGRKLAVMKQVFRNRVGELEYRYFKTHRKVSETAADINSLEMELMPADNGDPAAILSSRERLAALKERLSPTGLAVLAVILGHNQRMGMVIRLASRRAAAMGVNVTLRPVYIANALLISEDEVREALREIKSAYREVCSG